MRGAARTRRSSRSIDGAGSREDAGRLVDFAKGLIEVGAEDLAVSRIEDEALADGDLVRDLIGPDIKIDTGRIPF
jgi:hypothetical protein